MNFWQFSENFKKSMENWLNLLNVVSLYNKQIVPCQPVICPISYSFATLTRDYRVEHLKIKFISTHGHVLFSM